MPVWQWLPYQVLKFFLNFGIFFGNPVDSIVVLMFTLKRIMWSLNHATLFATGNGVLIAHLFGSRRLLAVSVFEVNVSDRATSLSLSVLKLTKARFPKRSSTLLTVIVRVGGWSRDTPRREPRSAPAVLASRIPALWPRTSRRLGASVLQVEGAEARLWSSLVCFRMKRFVWFILNL